MDNMILFCPASQTNIFHLSQKITFLPVVYEPKRKIIIKQYECKKVSKYQSQNKSFQILTVQQQDQIFFQLKQKQQTVQTKNSVYTIVHEGFFETSFAQAIFGQKKLKSVTQYLVSTIKWDAFKIQFIHFAQNTNLIIYTNELVLSLYKYLSIDQIKRKFRIAFEEILSRLVYSSKNPDIFYQKVAKDLFDLIEKHKQIVKQTPDGKQVNFRFVRYAELTKYHLQVKENKNATEKQQSSHQFMQIEK